MQNFRKIKNDNFAQSGFEDVKDYRSSSKESEFCEKKLKSITLFFEKSLSRKGNFREAVAPLLLEIELRWIPNFRLKILSPTRWWNNFWAISSQFWDRHFGLRLFSRKSDAWKFPTLGVHCAQTVNLAGPRVGALHSAVSGHSVKPIF